MSKAILEFRGVYSFLSNFYPYPMVFAGKEYPTSEHAYQAMKMVDEVDAENIRLCSTPARAKRQANFHRIRPNWHEIKLSVMKDVLRMKFAADPMRSQLLATGDRLLVEGNTWGDRFWGQVDRVGENHLGKILMQIRAEL